MKLSGAGVFVALGLALLPGGCSHKPDSLTRNAQAVCMKVGADGKLIQPTEPGTKNKAAGHPDRSAIEAFHWAVRTNDLATVITMAEADRRLLAEGSSWKDPLQGITPLYSAVDAGSLEMVKGLVGCGVETRDARVMARAVILVDCDSLAAIEAESQKAVEGFRQSGRGRLRLGFSRLKDIVKSQQPGLGNRIAILRYLLERGADPNAPNPDTGTAPLNRAVLYSSDGQGAKLLLRHGADPNARDFLGEHGFTHRCSDG